MSREDINATNNTSLTDLDKITSSSSKEIELKGIPEKYRKEATQRGRLERLDYETSGNSKYAYIYIPYGYDENDNTKKYNVFYLMHGGGGNVGTYFGDTNGNYFSNVIDNMIENKELEPLIIVTPTFYNSQSTSTSVASSATMVEKFHDEILKDIIPAVELKYNTYLESNNLDNIEQTREHRAFGGFSMGSVATWYELIYDLNYFKYFLPMSEDCWVYGHQGGASKPKETAEYLNDVLEKSKYKNDFYLYAVTGTDDIAYNALNGQMNAINSYAKNFIENKNYNYSVLDGGVHDHAHADRYVYDILPTFWK